MSNLPSLRVVSPSKPPPADTVVQEGPSTLLAEAREIFLSQSNIISELANRIDENFTGAIDAILQSRGHVVVTGVGKSGIIGQKVAATFCSTGTASFFLHPTEALHGDLGRVSSADIVLLISNSGETEEVMRLVPHFKQLGLPLIGLLGNPQSQLWHEADYNLDVSVSREACPHNLAPTNSILATVAMSDALAVSLMRARNFQPEDFARSHPGGSLGQRFATEVRAIMRTEGLPLLGPEQTLREALPVMSEARSGMGIVVQASSGKAKRRPLGVVTDGDVRRALQADEDALNRPIKNYMGKNPVTIRADATLADAQNAMQSLKMKAMLVVDDNESLVGVVDIFEI